MVLKSIQARQEVKGHHYEKGSSYQIQEGSTSVRISRRDALKICGATVGGPGIMFGTGLAFTQSKEVFMSEKRVLRGVTRSKGNAAGEALVSEQPISWAPFAIPNDTGIISIFEHKLRGQSVKDKIVVYPTVYGSTTGSIGLFFKVKGSKVGPKAIICRQVHPIDIGGAIAGEIPAVDSLDQDPLQAIKTGDWVEIRADEVGKEATVTITPKA